MESTPRKKRVMRGDYYKRRSKLWLVEQGYCVEYIEKYQTINTPKGLIRIKRDLFGSDMLAFKNNPDDMQFVQTKFNVKVVSQNVAKARAEFKKYPFPTFAKCVIHVWTPGAHEPIVEVVI